MAQPPNQAGYSDAVLAQQNNQYNYAKQQPIYDNPYAKPQGDAQLVYEPQPYQGQGVAYQAVPAAYQVPPQYQEAPQPYQQQQYQQPSYQYPPAYDQQPQQYAGYPGQPVQPPNNNQYYYQPPQTQQQQQPLLLPIPGQLNHGLLWDVGNNERRYFALATLGLLVSIQIISLCLVLSSMNLRSIVYATYNPVRGYKPFFFVCCTLAPLIMVVVLFKVDKFKKAPLSIFTFLLFTMAYSFIAQGLYSSSYDKRGHEQYYYYQSWFGAYVATSLGYIVIMLLALMLNFYNYDQELTLQKSNKSLVSLLSFYTILLLIFSVLNVVYIIFAYLLTSTFGNYLFYILKRIMLKGFQTLRSDDILVSPIVVLGAMVFPCYKGSQVEIL